MGTGDLYKSTPQWGSLLNPNKSILGIQEERTNFYFSCLLLEDFILPILTPGDLL